METKQSLIASWKNRPALAALLHYIGTRGTYTTTLTPTWSGYQDTVAIVANGLRHGIDQIPNARRCNKVLGLNGHSRLKVLIENRGKCLEQLAVPAEPSRVREFLRDGGE